MSWGLGWKRPSEVFRLTLNYGTEEPAENLSRTPNLSRSSSMSSSHSSSSSIISQEQELGFRIDLDWSASEDDDQVALKVQSQLMVALPMPQDTVVVELKPVDDENVEVDMKVVKRLDHLKAITMTKAAGSGLSDGVGVLTRLIRSNVASSMPTVVERVTGCGDHWKSVAVLSICGCNLSVSVITISFLTSHVYFYNLLALFILCYFDLYFFWDDIK